MFCKINNLDLNNCIFGNVACLHKTTPCFARNLWGICAPAHAWQYHCMRNFHALKEILGTQGESWHHNFNFYGLSHDEENWAVVLSRKQKAQQAVQLQDLWPGHVGFFVAPIFICSLKTFFKNTKTLLSTRQIPLSESCETNPWVDNEHSHQSEKYPTESDGGT